jgi:hypothetical protein
MLTSLPKLALPLVVRYEIQKQAKPAEQFSIPASSAFGPDAPKFAIGHCWDGT